MIKQNWNVSQDEVIRILEMHKNATKNNYLIKEQRTTTVKLPEKIFELPKQTFKSGFYSKNSLDSSQMKNIENKLSEIARYIIDNKGIPMSIQIITGESKPKNYDREKNVELDRGELAKFRGETIKQILTDFFQGLVDQGTIPSMPKIDSKTNIELGMKQVDYKKGVDSPDDKKYEQDQFIKFKIVSSGEKTSTCLVGLTILIYYINEQNNQFLCRGSHQCDNAIFDVYLNKTKIGVADLNNRSCTASVQGDCDRTAKLVVTNEMVEEIAKDPNFKDELTLWYSYVGEGTSAHTSAVEVRITNSDGEDLFPSACVNPTAARGDAKDKILLLMDGCGKPLKGVNDEMKNQKLQNIQGELNAEKRAKEAEETAKQEKIKQETHQAYLKQITPITTEGQGLFLNPNSNSTPILFNQEFSNLYSRKEFSVQGNILLGSFVGTDGRVYSFIDQETGKPFAHKVLKNTPFYVRVPIKDINIDNGTYRFLTKETKDRYPYLDEKYLVAPNMYYAYTDLPSDRGFKEKRGNIIRVNITQ